jgi:iron complex outermembrane receptor protein
MHRISPWFIAACAVVAGLAGTPAFAQNADEGEQYAENALEEIIVTALKRSQNLQNVPISVTAFSGRDLEHAGIQDVADLALSVPGLAVTSTGPGQTEVIIRGMPGRSGTSPTVGYYLDEVPISAVTRNLDVMLFDLDRVEVLRGPQGTLYGASSMGGTIKYITKRPNLSQFEGRAETTLSHIDGSSGISYKTSAVLNIPLQDERLGLRLLASHQSDEGYIDRYAIHPTDLAALDPAVPVEPNVNSMTQSGFRAVLEYVPNDNLTITPSVTYQKLKLDAPYLIDVPPGSTDDEEFIQTRLTREDREDEVTIANLTVNWERDRLAVTSSTSYFKRKTPGYEDYSKIATGILGLPVNVPWEQLDDNSSTTFIQELRVAGSISSLDYVVGVYYTDGKSHSPDINPYSAEALEIYGDDNGQIFGFDTSYESEPHGKLKEKAIFAEATYNVTDALAVTVGARAFEFKSSFTATQWGLFTGSNDPLYTEGQFSASDITPKLNISYQMNDDTLLFATASEGFRSGAALSQVPQAACADDLAELGMTESPTGVGSDTVWSYELGTKIRMLDRRMRLNGAVYFIDWADVQQSVSLFCGWPFVVNNGDAEVKGGELEWGFAVTEALSLSAMIAYSDAKLTVLAHGAQGQVGDRLLSVPKWAYSATADYSRPITSEWDGFVRISYNFVDEVTRVYDPTSPFSIVPSHDRVDLRIGVYQADNRWKITLFAQNLLNDVSESGLFGSNTSVNLPNTRAVALNRPRTIGLTASFNFN